MELYTELWYQSLLAIFWKMFLMELLMPVTLKTTKKFLRLPFM